MAQESLQLRQRVADLTATNGVLVASIPNLSQRYKCAAPPCHPAFAGLCRPRHLSACWSPPSPSISGRASRVTPRVPPMLLLV